MSGKLTVASGFYENIVEWSGGTLEVTGGTYNRNWFMDEVNTDTHNIIDNGDGTWTVVAK